MVTTGSRRRRSMGDSDDEYDRRRGRDKFRRERSDYQERRDDRSRGRDDWPERRRDYRDYDVRRSRSDRYSPARHDMSPPVKRMRRDWDDRGGYGGFDGGGFPVGGHHPGAGGPWGGPPQDMGGMVHMGGQHGGYGHSMGQAGGPQRFKATLRGMTRRVPLGEPEAGLTQPPMMTFKQFLGSQDDGIDDQEAVRKYNEYKMDFRRQQLNEFFVNHKEEEWFKSKYHPEECGKRKTEQVNALKRRLDAFLKLHEGGWVDAISIDVEKSDRIVRFLDAVVILLEGGTEYDLQALDEPIQEDKPSEGASFSSARDEKEASDKPEVKEESSQGGDAPSSPTRSDVTADDDKRHKRADDEEEDEDAKSDSKQSGGGRKRSYSSSSQSSSSSDSDSDDSDKDASDDQDSGVPGEESGGESKKASRKSKKKSKRLSSSPQAKKATKAKEERSEDGNEEGSSTKGEPEDDDEDGRPDSVTDIKGKGDEEEDESKATVDEQAKKGETGQGDGPKAVESEEKNRPRPLHRTCSIFLRNLAPTITKMEVEAMCKRYPGFLRVAIADPQPERRFFRRGWVTFERTVNIKEICWNLNNIRLRDCELGAIVNRDLSRRIRSVNGIASHKQVIRSDIKLAARIVHNLDNQRSLWIQTEAGTEPAGNAAATDQLPPIEGFGVSSKNPLLKNITDYLIEEASAEEEELLGGSADREENADAEDPSAPGGTNSEKDEMLIKVLDRLLVYLRVVHSVDYYNHSEYASEDEMPNRCGIMHARGSPPSGKVTPQEVADYISHFEGKISPFLQPSTKLSDEEANRLGKKDPEAEVEKFVVANTQELSKDKWLCPLSGKKFKGPEFVRKHIFNKHAEKVEEVRKEVEYFNNYLLDPKRPQLPEHPANRGGPGGGGRGGGGVGHEGPGMMGPFHGGFPPPPPFGFPRGHPGGFPGFGGRNFPDMYRAGFKRNNYGRFRSDPREVIGYHDLDEPQDLELF
ncbi:serrate RNA effector molecule homolog isoform X2 [Dermacentor andersoni]|uniref:serrate RNA effector molecule homolog isoform X2 n=1 Tax=Dermacentor andersoni TaxID=34620 RepID=UPI002415AFC1|nr:serrate RNA effector molecule homolog isoform X2 [Dermacentor andersoni]